MHTANEQKKAEEHKKAADEMGELIDKHFSETDANLMPRA
jgi:hypothetical protein